MKRDLKFIDDIITKIKYNNTYRKLKFGNIIGKYVNIDGKKLLNLCSNNYLGIENTNIKTIENTECFSRSIINNPLFKILESKLANHKIYERALIYPTGYMANIGIIPTIIQQNDIILSDELNHASIIDACKLSNGKILVYKHNDMEDLESQIKLKRKRTFIITEGIFSMDGDFANLKQIVEIANKKNAFVIMDDAHGDFVVGEDGRGSANYLHVDKNIDVYISSLSKGLGCFGGYVASKNNVIELCINRSRSFIYTSALPSQLINLALKRLKSNRETYRKKLWQNVNKLKIGLKKSGYQINSKSQIIPITIGDEQKTIEFSKYLLNNNIYAVPIRYPTVAKNTARIRISVTSNFSKQEIENIINIFDYGTYKFKLN
ncbi:MAG: pyridoxal phosphate-dependent aminotransferase family protein [Nitrosopumilaceae archaeon]|nr:pyridoxal phosphate-dependent aminotransferase family protein [Nitrosopumilaceae archaeon]